jgi:hypothetical protein
MRYFFNQAGSIDNPDDEGLELASLSEARIMAVQFAGETLRDKPKLVWKGDEFRIEVTDQNALMQFTVIIFGVDAPVNDRTR